MFNFQVQVAVYNFLIKHNLYIIFNDHRSTKKGKTRKEARAAFAEAARKKIV